MKKIFMILALTAGLMAGGNITPIAEPVQVVEDSSSYYVGIGYSVMDINSDYFDDIGDTFSDMGMTTLNAGYNVNEYVAVEARYTGDFDKYNALLFGKLSYANESDFTPYILLGVGTTDFDAYQASGGIGVEYAMNPNIALFGDYVVRSFDESDVYSDISTIGIKYTF